MRLRLAVVGRSGRARRPLRNLWIGTFLSRLGDSVTIVALVWIVFAQTRSAEGVALVQFAYTIFVPVGGLFVGAVLDRYRVVPVMVVDAFAKAGVIGFALLAAMSGTALVPAALLAALYLGLTWMVGGAGLPTLIAGAIPPDAHPRANMFDSLTYSSSAVLGPIVAGVLIEAVDPLAALVVGAGCTIVYGLLLLQVKEDLVSHLPEATVGALGVRGVAQGFRLVFSSRLLVTLTWMYMSLNAISTVYAVAMPVYAATVLNGGAAGYTFLLSIRSVGEMSGTILGRYLGPRLGVGRSIVLAVTGGGILFFPLIAVRSLPAAALCLFVGGLVASSSGPWVQTLRMRVIPPQLRSRAFGSIRTLTNSLAPPAALAGGLLVPIIGVPAIFGVVGAGWIATGLALASVRELRDSRA